MLGPILLALFSIRITFLSNYSAFSSIRGTDTNDYFKLFKTFVSVVGTDENVK